MQNEKELRAQAQQQLQQQLDRELTDDDLEKIAGGYSLSELLTMYADYCYTRRNHLSFNDWISSNGYTLYNGFDFSD